jgi:predicted unusual protein kinase regulating ubiquinone biosynthesis (AarF/ABC1/UbiB family)
VREARSAAELRAVICGAGATVLKLGQAASARPDVVGGVYRTELLRLVDDVPGFDGAVAEAVVVEELGLAGRGGIGAVFETFERRATAAASLGQVHKAVLRSGEVVAVKVLRPAVRAQAGLDLYLLRGAAAFARRRLRLRTDLVGVVDEFGRRLWEELDYTSEARNAERFAALYAGKVPGVYVPKVFREHTTGRVLVMEWVDGDKPAWAPAEDAERLIAIGVRCSLTQMLESGFVHGDPHSGNILRRAAGPPGGGAAVSTVGGDLCYLDFGMCVEVDRRTRVDLIRSITHLVNRNYTELAKDFGRLGFLPPGADTAALVPKLQKAFADARDGDDKQLSDLSFGKLADNLADLAYTSPIRIPVAFTILIRSLTILEGLALATRKEFKIIDAAYPFVVERLLEDDSPELQQCFEDVLIDGATGRLRWSRLDSILASKNNRPGGRRFAAAAAAAAPSPAERQQRAQSTSESVDRVVKYVLSARGKFLRDALTRELTEMLDASQLQAARRVSRATGGLLPSPEDAPDQAQLERAAALARRAPELLKRLKLAGGGHRRGAGDGGGGGRRGGGAASGLVDSRLVGELGKAAWVAVGSVAERNARRVVRRLGAAALDRILGPRPDGDRPAGRGGRRS